MPLMQLPVLSPVVPGMADCFCPYLQPPFPKHHCHCYHRPTRDGRSHIPYLRRPFRRKTIFAAAMVYVTRVEHFNAAHKLYNPNWTKEENDAAFGPCANENWHGHNYEIHVTVKGLPDPDTGFIIDVKKLSKIIKEHVLDKVDHKNLNMDVPFMAGKLASTENFVIGIWQQLQPHITGGALYQIRLYETPRIYVDYFGE